MRKHTRSGPRSLGRFFLFGGRRSAAGAPLSVESSRRLQSWFMRTWLDVCRDFAEARSIGPLYVEALQAFGHPFPRGGPPAPPEPTFDGTFAELERRLDRRDPAGTLTDDLSGEVDAAQAAMFERRVAAVEHILERFDDATARLLRVGFRQRLAGILAAPRPRALRVRALADFYWSYAGWHHHTRHRPRDGRVSLYERARTLSWTSVGAGIEHACLDGAFVEGPVHINVLRLSPGPAAVQIRAVDLRPQVAASTPFAEVVRDQGAVAGVSGGFFLYSEVDIQAPEQRFDPVGLLVERGRVLSPPVFPRGAVVIDEAGDWRVQRVGIGGMQMSTGRGPPIALNHVFTRAEHDVGPDVPSFSVAAGEVVGVGRRLGIPLGGFVVPVDSQARAAPGDPVSFSLPVLPQGGHVLEGVAGGPMLVQDGRICIDFRAEGFWGSAPPITFSQDETGDRNLLPRLAAGIDADGALVFAAIDGRNFDRALGATLRGTAKLLQALGCHTVTNLDGGSSKRMVLQGRTLDLPSTEIVPSTGGSAPVRPVHTALILE